MGGSAGIIRRFFFWTRRDNHDWSSAWPHHQAALDCGRARTTSKSPVRVTRDDSPYGRRRRNTMAIGERKSASMFWRTRRRSLIRMRTRLTRTFSRAGATQSGRGHGATRVAAEFEGRSSSAEKKKTVGMTMRSHNYAEWMQNQGAWSRTRTATRRSNRTTCGVGVVSPGGE